MERQRQGCRGVRIEVGVELCSRQAVKQLSILEVGSRQEAIRQAVGKGVVVEVGSEAVGIGVHMEEGSKNRV